jgi:hypothetical protein
MYRNNSNLNAVPTIPIRFAYVMLKIKALGERLVNKF